MSESERRKNTPEDRQQEERRLSNRSNHSPKASESWRLAGRQATENTAKNANQTLQAVAPDKWTAKAFAGQHCVVGPFSDREQAEAFSRQPGKQQDYVSHFFQLRSVKTYWFVEVFPDGHGRLMNAPEPADGVSYEKTL